MSAIGSGGFGRVFEVENRFDGSLYAVKRICLRFDLLEKILREVKGELIFAFF